MSDPLIDLTQEFLNRNISRKTFMSNANLLLAASTTSLDDLSKYARSNNLMEMDLIQPEFSTHLPPPVFRQSDN